MVHRIVVSILGVLAIRATPKHFHFTFLYLISFE